MGGRAVGKEIVFVLVAVAPVAADPLLGLHPTIWFRAFWVPL